MSVSTALAIYTISHHDLVRLQIPKLDGLIIESFDFPDHSAHKDAKGIEVEDAWILVVDCHIQQIPHGQHVRRKLLRRLLRCAFHFRLFTG